MRIASLAAAGCLSVACATWYPPGHQLELECRGAQCDRMWQAAQVWIAQNAAFRMQIANETVIETFGPRGGPVGAAAFTLTRQRNDIGARLTLRAVCAATVYGCVSNMARPAETLAAHMRASAGPP